MIDVLKFQQGRFFLGDFFFVFKFLLKTINLQLRFCDYFEVFAPTVQLKNRVSVLNHSQNSDRFEIFPNESYKIPGTPKYTYIILEVFIFFPPNSFQSRNSTWNFSRRYVVLDFNFPRSAFLKGYLFNFPLTLQRDNN